jgi:beta-lactamase regulating signal transducer with metallopeptidase domain
MNAALTTWLGQMGWLAAEIVIIVSLAGFIQKFVPLPSWRRTLWQTVFLALGLVGLLEVTGLARHLARWSSPKSVAGSPILRSTSPLLNSTPDVNQSRLSEAFLKEVAQRVSHDQRIQSERPPETRAAVSPSPFRAVPVSPMPRRFSLALVWMGWIWLLGSGVLLLRLALQRLVLMRALRTSTPVAAPELHVWTESLSASLGLRRKPRLLTSSRLKSPIAFGILQPTVVLPGGFCDEFQLGQQKVMVAHELAHLAARDPLWYLGADLNAVCWWWHPLVWWARHQLRLASETAADDASLLVANGPKTLAECLVQLGARLSATSLPVGLGIKGSRFQSRLGQRVERLLHLPDVAWRPPKPAFSRLIKGMVPLTLVASLILTTAWVLPQTQPKGNPAMNSLRKSWKTSLAAAALTAMLGNDVNAAPQTPQAPGAAPAPAESSPFATRHGQIAAPSPGAEAAPAPSAPTTAARTRPADTTQAPTVIFSAPSRPDLRASTTASGWSKFSPDRTAIQEKLEKIVLPEVSYDGLPLSEVIKHLNDEAKKLDPEGKGVNFIMNPNVPRSPDSAIDPNTGLPISSLPGAAVDLNGVIINISLPIHDVRLGDLLDIIQQVADRSIEYTVQNYGVVFRPAVAQSPPAEEPLVVLTFQVDPDLLFRGIKSAFGIEAPPVSGAAAGANETPEVKIARENIRAAEVELKQKEALAKQKVISQSEIESSEHKFKLAQIELERVLAQREVAPSRDVQQKLFRELFDRLGVDLEPPKSIFYNPYTSIVMIRVANQDANLVKAAFQTLGGQVVKDTTQRHGRTGGAVMGSIGAGGLGGGAIIGNGSGGGIGHATGAGSFGVTRP